MSALTAFPGEESALRRELAGAPVAHASLRRPLERCELARCRGMCCYDGIYVEPETAAVLQELADTEAPFFRALGVALPAKVIVHGSWKGRVTGLKTAVAPRAFSAAVADFPKHFSDTACVFLAPDGRCGLQVLAEARGRHKWYYKPFGCWLHPITTVYGGRSQLGLEDARSDPFRLTDYAGFVSATFCGREVAQGEAAATVLGEELDFLAQILGEGGAA
jgi:hypothetical protein